MLTDLNNAGWSNIKAMGQTNNPHFSVRRFSPSAPQYAMYESDTDTERLSYLSHSKLTTIVKISHPPDISIRDFNTRMIVTPLLIFAAIPKTALQYAISHIVSMRSHKQVIGPDARRSIALVANFPPMNYLIHENRIGYSMRESAERLATSIFYKNAPISPCIFSPRPKPTTGFGFPYLKPKTPKTDLYRNPLTWH